MRLIHSTDGIEELRRDRCLVALYLDHGFVHEHMNMLFRGRDGFDAYVTDAWHILIPHKGGTYAVDQPLSESSFDVKLCWEINRKFGLKHADLPALMFQDESAESGYYCVRLGGMTPYEMMGHVGRISDIAVQAKEDGPNDKQEYRDYVTHLTRVYLNRQKLLTLFKKAPKFGSFIGFVADVIDIAGSKG